MKARLYRGPHDGKVFEVPDHQRDITLMRPKSRQVRQSDGTDGWFSIETIADEYRMVEAYAPSGRWYPSVHPDGSVFFEWTKKRGTRIER